MKLRTLASRPVPVVGQGTWNLEQEGGNAVDALKAGLDAGLLHVDTAEMYGDGQVEELVGEAIRGRRAEVFLVTKVLPHNATRAGTRRALERSLQRLRTDVVDGYLLHWRGNVPLAESIEALLEVKRAGLTRSIGVSNFDEDDVDEAVRIAGKGNIACNQVLYHLEERAIEHAVIPKCEALGIAVVAYSPFGSGAFPARNATLNAIARAKGVSARQVALAFLTRRESVLAIPKAATLAHVVDNAAAGDLELTADELARLDAAFPLGKNPRELPTI